MTMLSKNSMSARGLLFAVLAVTAAMPAVGIGTRLTGSVHEPLRNQDTGSAGVNVPNPDGADADQGQTTGYRADLPSGVTQVDTYFYDFEDGTSDWYLEPGVWSRAPSQAGHALRGSGEGFARLTAHSGNVSSLRFSFRLEDIKFGVRASVLLSFDPSPTRYAVYFGAEGVQLSREQNGSFHKLGLGFVPIAPDTFYEAQILVGGGSIDVFLNGEGVVGVDDPTLPPGYVSFESLSPGSSAVYVDDVEVQIGPEPAPHPRAPRPPLALEPGPDVGPFVDGVYTGTVSLTGNDVLTLSQGRYTLAEGNIDLEDNTRLRIEPGAVLVFTSGTSPGVHMGVSLKDSASMEVDGGNIVTTDALVMIYASGDSSVTVSNARPWIHILDAGEDATVSIVNSRFVTTYGGQVGLHERASVDLRNSEIGSIALTLPAASTFEAVGLMPGNSYADFDLQRDLIVSGIDYNLWMSNVEITADTFGEGPYERGWIVFAHEDATTGLYDSDLRKFILEMPATGSDFAMSGLWINEPISLVTGGLTLNNVKMLGQWGFFIHGSRRATFEDCHSLWFFLYDNSRVRLRESTMNEFQPRHYTGTLAFEESEWDVTGEIVDGNDFLITGTVKIDLEPWGDTFFWSQSTVTRQFPVSVLSSAGDPVPGAVITLTRGSEVTTTTTNDAGEASVRIRFTDQDYTQPWQLTTSEGGFPLSLDFFTSTPIIVGGCCRIYLPVILRLCATP